MSKNSRAEGQVAILGAGMTGLAAGFASGLPVYEALEMSGGICASYYVPPGEGKRLCRAPQDEEAYRFEIGGGHWIWGGDPLVLRLIRSLAPAKSYERSAAVYLPDRDLFIPFPIQYHLRYLGSKVAVQALHEMVQAVTANHQASTMADWLEANFGQTLCKLFFHPFHELYTAGLWKTIAPQDTSKSPVNLSLAIQGSFEEVSHIGYNANFIYPVQGLNALAQGLAAKCNIQYGKRVVNIDIEGKIVYFSDGSTIRYKYLVSTIPLNRMIEICGLTLDAEPEPFTSVLVVNIGAMKGPRCPGEHAIYIPTTKTGFYRVGFYSNVDASFLPASARKAQEYVSIYVQKAYLGNKKPGDEKVEGLSQAVVSELQEWGWIKEAEVVDPTWVDVAYAWSVPGSKWRQSALQVLEAHGIFQVGRYARWLHHLTAQGISESLRNGLVAGAALRAGL